MLIDSHCHLEFPDFADEGAAEIVKRAKAAGIGHLLTICTRVAKFEKVSAISRQLP